jgi:L-alanine-DL-glutamate epimerase-like enolase superfamily enzyme
VRLPRTLEEHGFEFFEAPLEPEDVEGHARLARAADVAIAVSEPLRMEGGELVVPSGPGLGISLDLDRVRRDVATGVTVRLDARTI